ncbi:unnamed protein product, partial [Brenthis ino]
MNSDFYQQRIPNKLFLIQIIGYDEERAAQNESTTANVIVKPNASLELKRVGPNLANLRASKSRVTFKNKRPAATTAALSENS